MRTNPERAGILLALASAVLFGAATPAAKVLLGGAPPVLLAGLLYLGSGLGLSAWLLLSRWTARRPASSLGLRGADLAWLAAATCCGGVAAPILLLAGLLSTPASTASLLLNLEGLLTALLAWLVFREHLGARLVLGMATIVAGCTLLGWAGRPASGSIAGPLAIGGACLAWALDNNLTRKVSGGDAVWVATVKGLGAGAVNVTLALAMGARLPTPDTALSAGLVGLLGYGLSLVLFVQALRSLGTSRTTAYFSAAPFAGALFSISLLGEAVTSPLVGGAALVGLGVWLYWTEDHAHRHEHPEYRHEHWHGHDEHHDHGHPEREPAPKADHCHVHGHSLTVHTHPHYPDLHHRHGH